MTRRRRITDTCYFKHFDSGKTALRWNLPPGTRVTDLAHGYPEAATINSAGELISATRNRGPAYGVIRPSNDRPGWYDVSTRGTNGNGGVRHYICETLYDAELKLLRWADRRFRIEDT